MASMAKGKFYRASAEGSPFARNKHSESPPGLSYV